MPLFVSVVEPSLVAQTKQFASVENSCVTRRRVISVPALRDRLVCIAQTRSVALDLAARLVAVDVARSLDVVLGSRQVVIGALEPRVVVIPPEETCCE